MCTVLHPQSFHSKGWLHILYYLTGVPPRDQQGAARYFSEGRRMPYYQIFPQWLATCPMFHHYNTGRV